MFLLDTNVLSELRNPAKSDRHVHAWATQCPVTSFFISAITILELEFGALTIHPKDPVQGAVLRAWINQILSQFDGRILPVDTAVATRCAQLHVERTRPERDALIASTAYVHRLVMVTRNVRDFHATGVDIVNPWEHAAGTA